MEVFVVAPSVRCSSCEFPPGSVVRDVLEQFVPQQDFYVTTNGRRSQLEDGLQDGAVYHLEPRLCGGKGGFGSMLRALGAQIEKTTNREACRDLSGRRLRDVNHEKEMADWLKKQAEREAEKEQRRLERLQRKLAEPKHQFTDPQYQQQCHDLSERLEDSVLKGLQASSSGQVKVGDVSAAKRPNPDQNQASLKKRRTAAAAGFWTGLDELLSSEDEDDDDDESPSSSKGAAVTMTIQREEADPESSSSLPSAGPTIRTAEEQRPGPATEPLKSRDPVQPSELLRSRDPVQPSEPAEEQRPGPATEPLRSRDPVQPSEPAEEQRPGPATEPLKSRDPVQPSEPVEEQRPVPATEPAVGPPEDQNPPQQAHGEQQQLDLSSVTSVQQLEALGLDVLKEELMRRGLKCGGTLSERAARLLSVKGLSPDRIEPALLARPGKAKRK
ncbi:splicing regulator SDE2 [Anableps anableps]